MAGLDFSEHAVAAPAPAPSSPWLPVVGQLENSQAAADAWNAAHPNDPRTADTIVSPAGAVGYNQIMPATASALGIDPAQLTDRAVNNRAASLLLDQLAQHFGDDPAAILAAYNSTPLHAEDFVRSGYDLASLPPETQSYVRRGAGLILADAARRAAPQHPAAAPTGGLDFSADARPLDFSAQAAGAPAAAPAPTSALGTFGRAAARSAVPTAVGMATAGLGAELGGAAGAAAGAAIPGLGETGIPETVLGTVGGIGGGIAGYLGGSEATGWMQDKLMSMLPKSVLRVLGQGVAQQQADVSQHPYAEMAGELAPGLAFLRPGAVAKAAEEAPKFAKLMSNPVVARALPATIMGGQEAFSERGRGEAIDPYKVALAAGAGAVMNRETALGERVSSALPRAFGLAPPVTAGAPGEAAAPPEGAATSAAPPAAPTPDIGTTVGLKFPGAPSRRATVEHYFDNGNSVRLRFESGEARDYLTSEVMRDLTQPPPATTEGVGPPRAAGPALSEAERMEAPFPEAEQVYTQPRKAPAPTTGTLDPEALRGLDMATRLEHLALSPETGPGAPTTDQRLAYMRQAAELRTRFGAAPSGEMVQPAAAYQHPMAQEPAKDLGELAAARVARPALYEAPPVTPQQEGAEALQSALVDQQAAQTETQPTPKQIETGNYRKGKLQVQGLNISVETPRGVERRGVSPEGEPWANTNPLAHYGYITRTGQMGGDGEHVDAYVGPHPASKNAYIVDQIDPKTGQWDEHKVVLGAGSERQAREIYDAGFSDNSGPQRLGAITKLPVSDLKTWLKEGDTHAPFNAMADPDFRGALDDVREARSKAPTSPDLLTTIKALGGLKLTGPDGKPSPEGQTVAQVLQGVRRPGLINNKTGITPDYMREALTERGWFGTRDTTQTELQPLYDMLDRAARGERVYHPESGAEAVDERRGLLDEEMGRAGVKASDRPADAARKLLDFRRSGIEDMAREYEHRTDDAIEELPPDLRGLLAEYEYEPGADYGAEHEIPAGAEEPSGAPEARSAAEPAGAGAGRAGEGYPGGAGGIEPAAAPEAERAFRTTPAQIAAEHEAEVSSLEAEGTRRAAAKLPAQPTAEAGAEGLPQLVMPGMEQSARQAAAAREAEGHGRKTAGAEQREANEGLFAPKEPGQRTLFQATAAAPPFYSALTRAVEDAKINRGPAKDWLGFIDNLKNKGVKQEEVDWSGIRDWLAGHKGPVTKDEVLQHLRENEVRVREVERSDDESQLRLERAERALVDHLVANEHFDQQGARRYALDAARGELSSGQLRHQTPEARDLAQEVQEAYEVRQAGAGARRTKYSQYTLPGGENYRELLLTIGAHTIASREAGARAAGYARAMSEKYGDKWIRAMSPEEGRHYGDLISQQEAAETHYKSSHWDEPNVLAHVRFDDRTGPNREKILHVAEVQSDWHQQGRKAAYYDPSHPWEVFDPKDGRAVARFASEDEAKTEAARRNLDYSHGSEPIGGVGKPVPEAPFKTTWPELAMKRVLRFAAEHGYDKVTWDTGATNADRYDLSKQVESIKTSAGANPENFIMDITPKSGADIHLEVNKEGKIVATPNRSGDQFVGKSLADVVGKDMADKILTDQHEGGNLWGVRNRKSGNWSQRFATKDEAEQYWKNLPESVRRDTEVLGMTPRLGKDYRGLDLKVGGEGLHAFYDKILPGIVNRIGKKWGAKVESGLINPEPSGFVDRAYEGGVRSNAGLLDFIQSRDFDRLPAMVQQQIRNFRAAVQSGHTISDASRELSNAAAEALGGKIVEHPTAPVGDKVHQISITPAMRESVMRGQPLFQAGREGARAATGERVKLTDDILAQTIGDASPAQAAVLNAVDAEAKRIVPNARVRAAAALEVVPGFEKVAGIGEGARIAGATYFNGAKRLVAWSLESPDAVGTLRHEAVHYLRGRGLITPEEWRTLSSAAEKDNWIGKHDIEARYPGADQDQKVEESVAEEFSKWHRDPSAPDIPAKAKPVFERIADFLHAVGGKLRSMFGRNVTADDVFRRIASGEIGARDMPDFGEGTSLFAQHLPSPEEPAVPPEGRDSYDNVSDVMAEDWKGKGAGAYARYVNEKMAGAWAPGSTKILGDVPRRFIFPRTLAALDWRSGRYYNAMRFKDEAAHALQADYRAYANGDGTFGRLPKTSQDKVLAGMELLRLDNRDLEDDGRSVVLRNENHDLARLSKPGESVVLNPTEAKALFGLKRMFAKQWGDLIDATARKLGWDGPLDTGEMRRAAEKETTRAGKRNLEHIADLVEAMRSQERAGYIPLMRFGDHYVAVKAKPGVDKESLGGFPRVEWYQRVETERPWQHIFGQFKRTANEGTSAEVEKAIAGLSALGKFGQFEFKDGKWQSPTHVIEHGQISTKPEDLRRMNIPAIEKLMQALEHRTEGGEKAWQRNEAYQKLMDEIRDQLYEELKAGFKKRSFTVPGYDPDMRRAIGSYNFWISHHIAGMQHDDTIQRARDLVLSHPNKNVREFWKNWDAYQDKRPGFLERGANALKNMAFYWTLAGVPAVAVHIAMHGPLVGLSTLKVGIPAGEAATALGYAMRDVTSRMRADTVKGLNYGDIEKIGRTAPEKAFLGQIGKEGLLHSRLTDEIGKVKFGEADWARGFRHGWNRVSDVLSSSVSAADQLTRIPMALAAFRLAERPGGVERFEKAWGDDENFKAAIRQYGRTPEAVGRFMVSEGAFDYGKRNMPEIGRGAIGGLLWQFHNFQTRALAKMIQLSGRMGPEGRKSAALMTASLAALTGASGIWFTQDIENLYDRVHRLVTGIDPDTKDKIRDWLENDAGWGRMGADMVLRGPISSILGVDLTSRLGFGDPITREIQDYGTGTPKWQQILDMLPAFSVASRAVQGAEQRLKSHQGLPAAAAAAAPGFVRNPLLGLGVWPQEGVRSQAKGHVIVPRGEITGADQLRKALGWTPLDVTRAYERQEEMWRRSHPHG